ncbi:MAG: LptA/OstA family protein [Pseudomonadota bacterium]
MPAPVASLVFGALALLIATTANAQTLQTGFADFGTNRGAPIEIEADELEVQDKQNVAIFSGNVLVKQQGAALQTAKLTVFYAQSALPTEGVTPATPQNQRISRLEAEGRVLITADGQSATGDVGSVNFDDRTLALNGNVTLTQDGNVVTGDRITVNLDTGVARVQSRGRVRVLLNPGGN